MIEMQKEMQNEFRILGIVLIQSVLFALAIYLYETEGQSLSLYESMVFWFALGTVLQLSIYFVYRLVLDKRNLTEEVELYRRRIERERRLAETKFLTTNAEFRQKIEQLYSEYAYNGSEETRP